MHKCPMGHIKTDERDRHSGRQHRVRRPRVFVDVELRVGSDVPRNRHGTAHDDDLCDGICDGRTTVKRGGHVCQRPERDDC